ncbi:MAG: glucan biosynthesis protein G [Gammaproteobacteria bacterium]|jgi:periplasmic glucans biosynthesis protein
MRPAFRSAVLLLCLLAPGAWAMDFESLADRAHDLARSPYKKAAVTLPKELQGLSYDQYRDIRFRPEKSLWRNSALPFEVQLFHPGLYYDQAVKIHLITAEGVEELKFDPAYFDYGRNPIDPAKLKGLGFAGLRVHYPLNQARYKDELVVFQGASYFRALGKQQRYGLSARGLAVDTGLISGEEFPTFTEFWIEWPRAQDHALTLYALLDSRRVTGAYRFRIEPGTSTVMDVKSRIFLRAEVGKLGIAPLTSMFLFGENQPARGEDYRPEVHDSDGLLIQTDHEWLWRPLVNPRRLLITSFAAVNPRGYGLLQRDRRFANYEDLEARYDLRPSAWITPRGDWGSGRVELTLIPTPDETNDNVVAYWVPDVPPPPGEPLDLEYRLSWQMRERVQPPLATVAQTRRGHGYVREQDDSLHFMIDFEGGALPRLPADAEVVSGVWMDANGELIERQTYRNEATGGWRLALRFRRKDPNLPVELRAFLRRDQETLSETWSYILPADTR